MYGNLSSINSSVYANGTLGDQPLYLETNYGLMILAALSIGVSCTIGAVGNVMIILSVCLVRALRTTGNIFVVNLALSDIIITALIGPFNVIGIIAGRPIMMVHTNLCVFVAAVCGPACMSSMWNMFAIAVNRYVLICKPHRYPSLFTVRNCVVGCICIWIFARLIHLPTHFGWAGNRFNEDYYICTVGLMTHSYAIFYMMMGVPLPLAGIFFCYTSIFFKVSAARRKVRHTALENSIGYSVMTNDVSQAIENATVPKPSYKSRHGFCRSDIKLAKTLFAAFFIFLLCWSPFVLFVLANQPSIIPKWLYVLAIMLAHSNAAVNPILYGLTNTNFRQGYQLLFGCGPDSSSQKPTKSVTTNPTNSNPTVRPRKVRFG